jgi:hypothetical protein
MKRIGIIGCGWLGIPLFQHLQSQGYHCFGTVRQSAYIHEPNFHFWDGQQPMGSNLQLLIRQSDALVITLPPQKTLDLDGNKMQHAKWAKEISIINDELMIIYTSSTSVYGEKTGELHEKDHDVTTRAFAIEKAYLRYFENASIVRFGGLIGPDRHPGNFIVPDKLIKQPEAWVNMTHLDDAIGAIIQILRMQCAGIYNVVSPIHSKRREFYTAAFQSQNKIAPLFEEFDAHPGKKVISEKIMTHLGYSFRHSSILTGFK